MSIEMAIAGVTSFLLALGHIAVGRRWVIANLAEDRLPRTPFGPPSLTLSMVRFTWHVVSVLLVAFGILFTTLTWAPHANPKTLLLRWLTGLWLAATATALWEARRRPRNLLRFPAPVLFVVVAAMCWTAST